MDLEILRIVLEGLRGDESIAVLCRCEGINLNLYYKWSKEFLDAGKRRLDGDIKRQAASFEVTDLCGENQQLKELVADLSLKNAVLKKSLTGTGQEWTDDALRPIREDGDNPFGRGVRASSQAKLVGVNTLFVEPGSPWENGYIESFNGKLRDELLNGEIFINLFEAKVLIEEWRKEYNQVRLHSSLGYKPPAPKTIIPKRHCGKTLTQQLVQ